jgi:hypothetical protein
MPAKSSFALKASSVTLPFQRMGEFQLHAYDITFALELHRSPPCGIIKKPEIQCGLEQLRHESFPFGDSIAQSSFFLACAFACLAISSR